MNKLLIVVDMQNDFIDGSLGSPEAKAIIPAVIEKIKSYEAEEHEVVYTMDTHFANYLNTLEGKKLPVEHCIEGTKGWELQEDIAKFAGKRFKKSTFGSVACSNYAAEQPYESVELVGVCTDICVISNAMLLKAILPGTPILVDRNCCAGVTPDRHNIALEAMKMCQIDVI